MKLVNGETATLRGPLGTVIVKIDEQGRITIEVYQRHGLSFYELSDLNDGTLKQKRTE